MAKSETKVPRHVAIIMDGNGRWATQKGWPRLVGHRKGAERVKEIVRAAPDLGVEYLTVYAFSTENWKRSTEEVLGLMDLFRRYIEREADSLSAEGVRMRFIGDRSRLKPPLQNLMAGIEERTRGNSRLNLTVAINYGGRDELIRAAHLFAGRPDLAFYLPGLAFGAVATHDSGLTIKAPMFLDGVHLELLDATPQVRLTWRVSLPWRGGIKMMDVGPLDFAATAAAGALV